MKRACGEQCQPREIQKFEQTWPPRKHPKSNPMQYEGCRLFASLWNLDMGIQEDQQASTDYQRLGTSPKCPRENLFQSCNFFATYKDPSGDCKTVDFENKSQTSLAGFPSDMVTLRIQADTASRRDAVLKVFCSKSEQPTATWLN